LLIDPGVVQSLLGMRQVNQIVQDDVVQEEMLYGV